MYSEISEQLERAGINPSLQRIKIMECIKNCKNHPTADEVYNKLSEEMPKISKATVYNSLNLFTEKELLKTVTTKNSGTHYDAVLIRHGHFICNSCGRIFDFSCESCGTSPMLEGFLIQSEETLLKGLCKDCLEKQNNN